MHPTSQYFPFISQDFSHHFFSAHTTQICLPLEFQLQYLNINQILLLVQAITHSMTEHPL